MTPFITTYTGRNINPFDMKVEDVSILDIAHHLSLINRFNGATREPLDVAYHSYHVHLLLRGTVYEREALFHDAAEAYIGDMTKWVKHHEKMSFFRELEEENSGVICKALGLNSFHCPEHCPEIEEADRLMVRMEAEHQIHPNSMMFTLERYPKLSGDEHRRIFYWTAHTGHVHSKFLFLTTARKMFPNRPELFR